LQVSIHVTGIDVDVEKLKQKKDEWDRWNPDRNHPIVHCIDESKLAGLKETIKPNRGILYR
jgi:hypothetical protein